MKKCGKCKKKLPVNAQYFYRNKNNKDGFGDWCKKCLSAYMHVYREGHKIEICEKRKKYRIKHRAELIKKAKMYRATHKPQIKEYRRRTKNKSRGYEKKYKSTLRGYLKAVVWKQINQRCNNPSHKAYRNYGGRGIQNKFNSFNDFYSHVVDDLKANPFGLTIDRINNDGNYEQGNIRFVTRAVNNRNRRKYYQKRA